MTQPRACLRPMRRCRHSAERGLRSPAVEPRRSHPMCALHDATSPVGLMDELERFIEFWCGPRRPEYGEPPEALQKLPLPDPLRRLYAFAGRWPPINKDYHYVGHIFGAQDALVALDKLQYLDDGKVVFLW